MPSDRQAQLTPTSDFTDLVLHLFAQVRAPEPGNIFEPRYMAWVAEHLGAELLLSDTEARAIASRWHPVQHQWPLMFPTLSVFSAAAAVALDDDPPGAEPRTLLRLLGIDGVAAELMHATLGVAYTRWQRHYSATILPALQGAAKAVAPGLELAAKLVPSLAARRVELAFALGQHGRAYPGRIVVGAPLPWNGLSPERAAVVAAHEAAVLDAGEGAYVEVEWRALHTVAAAICDAPERLRAAHRQWLATLDLGGLLDAAVARGAVTTAVACQLTDDRDARPGLLARVGAADLGLSAAVSRRP